MAAFRWSVKAAIDLIAARRPSAISLNANFASSGWSKNKVALDELANIPTGHFRIYEEPSAIPTSPNDLSTTSPHGDGGNLHLYLQEMRTAFVRAARIHAPIALTV